MRWSITGEKFVKKDEELFDEEFLKKLEYLAIVAHKLFSGRFRAERRSKKIGSGIEFADYREYTPGDDTRYLDWNIYGRFDRLLLKLFEEEEDLHIYILLDTSYSLKFGSPQKIKYAKKIAAALAYIGLSNLDRISVISLGEDIKESIPPARGKNRIYHILNFLQQIEVEGKTDLIRSLKKFVSQYKRKGIVVLISDMYNHSGYFEPLNILRYNKYETYLIHVIDPVDENPEPFGDIEIYDCETKEKKHITVTPELLKSYKKRFGELLEEMNEYCRKKGVRYFKASTQVPFDELVLSILRKGGLLG